MTEILKEISDSWVQVPGFEQKSRILSYGSGISDSLKDRELYIVIPG